MTLAAGFYLLFACPKRSKKDTDKPCLSADRDYIPFIGWFPD
jgi:hypothetical protein